MIYLCAEGGANMARKAVQKIKVNKTKSDSVSLLDTGSFSVYMEVIL